MVVSIYFMSGKYSQAFGFFEKVKERLCSQDDYQTFLKFLHIYSNGIIKRNDLQNMVCATMLCSSKVDGFGANAKKVVSMRILLRV